MILPPRKKRILVAVDLGVASEYLVKAALSLAKQMGADLDLLYACAFPAPDPAGFYPAASRAIDEQAKLDLRRLAQSCGLSASEARLFVRSGKAASVIVRAGRELQATLIVLGTHRPHRAERLLVGSIAESVSRNALRPVLVLPCVPAAERSEANVAH